MASTPGKVKKPTWSDLKSALADADRPALLALVHSLYGASKDNQAFLHARFGLGGDPLAPYKTSIERWLWPDVFRGQDTSVAKAKKALADYKKADGQPAQLAELMTFYCEQAAGFAADVGLDDEGYLNSLVSVYAQALKLVVALDPALREALLERLFVVREVSESVGYGVGDEMVALQMQELPDK